MKNHKRKEREIDLVIILDQPDQPDQPDPLNNKKVKYYFNRMIFLFIYLQKLIKRKN